MTESQRFLEIDKLRVVKLEKLRDAEVELEAEREELRILREVLAKEREVSVSLLEEKEAFQLRLESLTASFEAEKALLASTIENSTEFASLRKAEVEKEVERLNGVVDSLRREMANLNEEILVLDMENKSIKGSASTRQADFLIQIDRLNREVNELTDSKNRSIAEQRAMIDQLSNSMSEAATQLIESQNVSKFHHLDLEKRDGKIFNLEQRLSEADDVIRDKNKLIFELEDRIRQLEKQIDQLILEKQIVLSQLSSSEEELKDKNSIIKDMKAFKNKSQLIQNNLVNELQSLPVINKRLESDCAFFREDLKKISDRLKICLKENESMTEKLKIIDSFLSPEQRIKLASSSINLSKSDSNPPFAENKRLQIEAVELRMRLVDAQATRDKAQAQLIDQSQLIAKLQKDLIGNNENFSPESKIHAKPLLSNTQISSSEEVGSECKQQ